MAEFTNKVENEQQNTVKKTSDTIEVEAELRKFERLAEVGQALGSGIQIGEIKVPPPSLVSMALLEQIDSPFVVPGSEEDPREIRRKHILEALYVLIYPRESVGPIDQATRALAGVQHAEKRAEADPKLWEAYLDAMAAANREGFAAFDKAMWAWASGLPPVDIEEAAAAIADMIAMSSRGYAMFRDSHGDAKKKTNSENEELSGSPFMRWPCIGHVARAWMKLFTRSRS